MPTSIQIDRLTKRFSSRPVLHNISLLVNPGELYFLLGPSGCGKTTLLRAIAGLTPPDEGRILLDHHDVTRLPPHLRNMAMVFQSYALWPHLSLLQNVAFGLEMRRLPKMQVRRRALDALSLVRLADRANAKPNELSGGQQQRVALARALVIHPQCLLLDEPLSNLDAKLRLDMRTEIRRICKQAGLTAIYVTHDQKEALAIADRLAILNAGHIIQTGTPREVYTHPATPFVAQFIGETSFINGTLLSVHHDLLHVQTPAGLFLAPMHPPQPTPGSPITLSIRPESVLLLHHPPAQNAPNTFPAQILSTHYLGETAQHLLSLPGHLSLKALEIRPTTTPHHPAPIRVQIPPETIVPFPCDVPPPPHTP